MILKATDLRNVDFFGKSDPFVSVSLLKPSGDVAVMKTATKTDDLNPVWEDEHFNFACEGTDFLDYSLLFKVLDTGLGPDVELGEAKVPVDIIPLAEEGIAPTVFEFSL